MNSFFELFKTDTFSEKEGLNNMIEKADYFMLIILWAHLPIVGLIAPYQYGTWKEGLIAGFVINIIGTISYIVSRGTFAHRLLNGLLLLSYSIVLITLQFGRIEMHFHVFVSLPLLLLYRDWKIIPPAAALIALHHTVFNYCQTNGIKLFGVPLLVFNYANGWDIVILHATFVVFETTVLIFYSRLLKKEYLHVHQTNKNLEELVNERSKNIEKKSQTILRQQEQIVSQAKLSSLGEMAGGIAHEINNPLAIITFTMRSIRKMIEKDMVKTDDFHEAMNDIDNTVQRITKIVSGLRNVSRNTTNDNFDTCKITDILDDVLPLCFEKLRHHDIKLKLVISEEFKEIDIEVLRVQLSQVLLNLITNAFDEICARDSQEKWIRIEGIVDNDHFILKVIDAGRGIPKDIQKKMFQPFFTTKDIGKGTGLGLSLSRTIIERHNGKFTIDNSHTNTCFVIKIPIIQNQLQKIS